MEYPTCLSDDDGDGNGDDDVSNHHATNYASFTTTKQQHQQLKRKVGVTSTAQMRHLWHLYRKLISSSKSDDRRRMLFDGSGENGYDDHPQAFNHVDVDVDGRQSSGSSGGDGSSDGSRLGDSGSIKDYMGVSVHLFTNHGHQVDGSGGDDDVDELHADQLLPYDPCAEQNTIGM